METTELIERLAASNRKEVARATGLPYMYLSRLVWGHIKNPGSKQADKLRAYFTQPDQCSPRTPAERVEASSPS